MILQALASGSNGNCFLINSNNHTLLIDAGISRRRILQGIHKLGLKKEQIQYILITHSHSDHTAGLAVLHSHLNFKIIAHQDTIEEIRLMSDRDSRFEKVAEQAIAISDEIEIEGFVIKPLDAIHDVAALAFSILSKQEQLRFTYTTDNNEHSLELQTYMKQSDFILMESNNDPEMLEHSRYPIWLKNRIRNTHMSNPAMAASLSKVLSEKTKAVFLGHLSEECNTPGHVCEIMDHLVTHMHRKNSPHTFRWIICTRYESSSIVQYKGSLKISDGVHDLNPIMKMDRKNTLSKEEYIKKKMFHSRK